MRIGLIDGDNFDNISDCFPNLVLMKLSAYHKVKGDEVEWYDPMIAWAKPYDRVYESKVFSFTPKYPHPINASEIFRGGVDIAYPLSTVRKYSTSRRTRNCRMRLSI